MIGVSVHMLPSKEILPVQSCHLGMNMQQSWWLYTHDSAVLANLLTPPLPSTPLRLWSYHHHISEWRDSPSCQFIAIRLHTVRNMLLYSLSQLLWRSAKVTVPTYTVQRIDNITNTQFRKMMTKLHVTGKWQLYWKCAGQGSLPCL